jgi:purine-binding chemotaxis protein CheW
VPTTESRGQGDVLEKGISVEKQTNGLQEQMLTFHLGSETYGVDILRVKEIRGWTPVTRIPQAPPQVLGVLNLRGAVVPIIDLRMRFRLASAEFLPTTVIIVLSVEDGDGRRECGVVVDSVSDVADVQPEALRPPPSMCGDVPSAFIKGLVAAPDGMLILLNVDALVAHDLHDSSLRAVA